MKLSKHFQDRWRERVKRPLPTTKEIDDMVNEALLLQRYRDVYTPRGRRITILELYWVADKGLVLKVNKKADIAVTVLTSDMMEVI